MKQYASSIKKVCVLALTCIFTLNLLLYASYIASHVGSCWTSALTRSLVDSLQGKEIIEYYLRELEEEGITYIPRWTPPVVPGNRRPQLPPPSSARAIPVKGAKNGPDSKDPAELAVGTPDGRSTVTCHYSVLLFKLFFAGKTNITSLLDGLKPLNHLRKRQMQVYVERVCICSYLLILL